MAYADPDNEMKEIIRRAFEAYDANGSGYLEKEEIRRMLDDACKELGTPMISDAHVEKIIDVIDVNKDGKLSIDEVSASIQPILEKQME